MLNRFSVSFKVVFIHCYTAFDIDADKNKTNRLGGSAASWSGNTGDRDSHVGFLGFGDIGCHQVADLITDRSVFFHDVLFNPKPFYLGGVAVTDDSFPEYCRNPGDAGEFVADKSTGAGFGNR